MTTVLRVVSLKKRRLSVDTLCNKSWEYVYNIGVELFKEKIQIMT